MNTHCKHILCLLALIACFGHTLPAATEISFPSDAPVWNVKNFGAVGNGVADDTQAFRNAITAALDHNSRYTAIRIVYVPNGTYRITGSLEARNLNRTDVWDGWRAGFFLQGESQAGTIIRLADNAPGFTTASTPKAVIKTGSEQPNGTDGTGNQAFRHYIRNLTVNTGSGNAGAIGIDFLTNNRGGIYNVTVRSGDANRIGHTGIAMDRVWPGPGFLKNVTVNGFSYGISMWNHYQYSMTMEDITLQNQIVYGFRMKNNVATIRNLTSTNSVPSVFVESDQAHLTLLNAQLTGTGAAVPAIDNKSMFYGRNITTSGYNKAIEDRGSQNRDITAMGTIDEYRNRGTFKEYTDSIDGAIRLPVEETPVFHDPNFSNWAKVDGAAADDLPAIQAAIDSGKSTVYLPAGDYTVSNTIVLRGNVRKIIGLSAGIGKTSNFPAGAPILRFAGSSAPQTIIKFVRFFGPVEHASSKDLALVNCDISHHNYYNTAQGTGALFLEDVIMHRLVANHPQPIWARQLNMEFASDTFLVNNGGAAWIMGYKTEGKNGSPAHNKNGGWMELFGGFFYANDGVPTVPMIINENAQLTANYRVNGSNNYAVHVRDIRSGTTRDFTSSKAPNTNNTDLYSGATQTYPTEPALSPVKVAEYPFNNSVASVDADAGTTATNFGQGGGYTSVDYFSGTRRVWAAGNGGTAESNAAAGHYFTFTVTPTGANKLSLDTLSFKAFRGGSSPDRVSVFVIPNGGPKNGQLVKVVNNLSVAASSTSYSANLVSADFDNLNSAQIRIVFHGNNQGKGSNYIDDVALLALVGTAQVATSVPQAVYSFTGDVITSSDSDANSAASNFNNGSGYTSTGFLDGWRRVSAAGVGGSASNNNTAGEYFTFTLTPASGKKLYLDSISLKAKRAGSSPDRITVYALPDGGSPLEIISNQALGTGATTFSANLGQGNFDALNSLVIRIIFHGNNQGNGSNFVDDIELVGAAF